MSACDRVASTLLTNARPDDSRAMSGLLRVDCGGVDDKSNDVVEVAVMVRAGSSIGSATGRPPPPSTSTIFAASSTDYSLIWSMGRRGPVGVGLTLCVHCG